MEIIIAAILTVLAINHTDEAPVPNLYQQPDQTLTISAPYSYQLQRGAGAELLPAQSLKTNCPACR